MTLMITPQELSRLTRLAVYPRSVTEHGGTFYFLARRGQEKVLGLLAQERSLLGSFVGDEHDTWVGGDDGQGMILKLCPTEHSNAAALRVALPFTSPQVVGVRKSVGCGDRLGLATPGHVRAMRGILRLGHQPGPSGQTGITPIFAQQSIREMTRTGRTPDRVMDDATWGVFQEGWREGFGADADHLKVIADVDVCVDAGFTMYTIDPGDHVDDDAAMASPTELSQRVEALPWDVLESSPQAIRAAYLSRSFDLGTFALTFTERELLLAAAKYGRAVAHTVTMYRHLANRMGNQVFELEMSVDETATPTTTHEHFFVANELRRLDVRWVSLAPRFVGRFEKGVDYIGDLKPLEADLTWHAAVARALGPYKLSVHSGSDKFSIYPIIARVAGDLVHLKTAGTSYLEALRAVATIDPALFREILTFAEGRYETDKASYHVSADPRRFPDPRRLADDELSGVLDTFDGRQLLHVTFGSVLTTRDDTGGYRFRDRLLAALSAEEELYYTLLESHIGRHLAPFAA